MAPKMLRSATILAIVVCSISARPALAAGCGSQSTADATSWFERYATAWKKLDAAGASALFSELATYREDPFEQPLRGEKQIRKYWNDVAHGQHDVDVNYEVVSSCGGLSIVHWHASFSRVPSGQKVELDGIAEVTLDKMSKCIRFREWWDRKQSK